MSQYTMQYGGGAGTGRAGSLLTPLLPRIAVGATHSSTLWHGSRESERAIAFPRLPVARQPLTAVSEAAPLRSERLLDLNARLRGVDANAKSAGNAERLQLSATAPNHREVVSGGGHQTFLRPADGCADPEAPLAGPHPADAWRPPSAPCGKAVVSARLFGILFAVMLLRCHNWLQQRI